jgi:hypothetical protein
MRKIIYLLSIIVFISACKKSEIEQVPFNEPPPDHTISNVTIENYITRTYILTLGREPDSVEFSSAKAILTTSNLDSTSRRVFLNAVFSSHDYRPHVYEENKNKLLNFADTTEFSHWIYLFNLFLQDTSQQSLWPYFQYQKDRMVDMQNAYYDYVNDSIEINELHRKLCNNYLYDQINMGSANFVISTFMQLINRNPTNAEQQAGVSMVDGNNAILFLQAGSSKDDYLNIFTSSSNYFEGQVVFMYLKYLNRNPTTIEMTDGTLKYSTSNDYTSVQRDILSTDEFIGL